MGSGDIFDVLGGWMGELIGVDISSRWTDTIRKISWVIYSRSHEKWPGRSKKRLTCCKLRARSEDMV